MNVTGATVASYLVTVPNPELADSQPVGATGLQLCLGN
jgi:hypothetical protein